MKHIKLFEDYNTDSKLGIGDNTNMGIIQDVTETQFLINDSWYHKSIIKPSTSTVEPVKASKPELKQLDYEFAYTCVSPSSDEELEAIIDDLYDNEITTEEFLNIIPFEDVNGVLPVVYDSKEQMLKDYHINCYKGSFYFDEYEDINRENAEEWNEEYDITQEGEFIDYVVMVHSAIEHVWKARD